ncbi:GTPase Era, partial [Acinetobacter baumannii]
LAKAADERMKFEQIFMISALSADGTDDLRKALAAALPEGPFLYPEDQMSVAPMRHLAAEITREKIYQQLHQELPYQSTV